MNKIMQKAVCWCVAVWVAVAMPVMAGEPYVSASGQKMVTGAAVRVREAPSVEAKEVGKLTMGTVLDISQRTSTEAKVGDKKAYWYQVTTPLNGWVFGGFVQDFEAAKADAAWLALARNKLGGADVLEDMENPKPKPPFTDLVELARFLKEVAAKTTNRETKGELELDYWRAVQWSLDVISEMPQEKHSTEPYASWWKGFGGDVFFDEIAATFRVRTEVFWKLADTYKNAAIGDAIAFQAANVYPGGECEGMIDCVSGRSQMMEGEYIKRYPQGKYINKVLTSLNGVLKYILKDWKNQPEAQAGVNLTEWETLLKPVADSKEARQAREYLAKLRTMKK